MSDPQTRTPKVVNMPAHAMPRRNWAEQLFRLLPAVYQIRDVEERGILADYLRVIGEQVQLLEDDVAQLYDNWFVETCDAWAVPYLGDLVGYRRVAVAGAGEPGDAVTPGAALLNRYLYPRREIANLVRRRRSKGTLSVLEEVARDVAGWPARAVEFSKLVTFFQNVRHPQPDLGKTLDTSNAPALARLNTPFDKVAHTVDVRSIQSQAGVGWYHPRKLGLFVWRRTIHSATNVVPFLVCETVAQKKQFQSYTFSRLGHESALYVRPVDEIDAEHGIATELNLPVPLYRHLLSEAGDVERRARTTYYGLGIDVPKSLAITVRWPNDLKPSLIPASHVHVCDLSKMEKRCAVAHSLHPKHVAVDPERGWFLFHKQSKPDTVRVSYHLAATDDMGGGEYDRPQDPRTAISIVRLPGDPLAPDSSPRRLLDCAAKAQGTVLSGQMRAGDPAVMREYITHAKPPASPADGTTNQVKSAAAAPDWVVRQSICIELPDGGTFEIAAAETLLVAKGVVLEIRAAHRAWPLIHIRAKEGQECATPWRVLLAAGAKLILNGLQICGAIVQVEDFLADDSKRDPQERSASSNCCGANNSVAGSIQSSCCDSADPAKGDRTVRQRPAPAELHIGHTTFVPGGRAANASCDCQPKHDSLNLKLTSGRVCIKRSVLGTLNVEHGQCDGGCKPTGSPATAPCPLDPLPVTISDSIIDAGAGLPAIYGNCCGLAHADLSITRSTILGDVRVQQIARAEDSLFDGIVNVSRRGVGYMRFCYVVPPPVASASHAAPATGFQQPDVATTAPRTPKRFHCLPESVRESQQTSCSTGGGAPTSQAVPQPSSAELMRPEFVSRRYGDPGYCELSATCPQSIRQGAEDESELGVFHDLYIPQRTAALRARLEEYTPAEMQSAVIFADDLNPPDHATGHEDCCHKHH